MRIVRAAVIALLMLVVAVTPLSAIYRPGVFEAQLQASFRYGPPKLVVEDRTGLVAGIAVTNAEPPASLPYDRHLVISWLGGCSDQVIWLTFEASGNGYRISTRTSSNGCPFMIGLGRTVVLVLRAPVDATTVEFDELEAAVT